MKIRILSNCIVPFALVAIGWAQGQATSPIPHLEKRGAATQLIVDGKPFLALSGELNNTVSSDLEKMREIWPMLADKVHLNTVLTGMAWSWIEPQEGKFDFSIADAAIENAQKHDLRIVWLWFASWKNGMSGFVPSWVKTNQKRFPRAQILGGGSLELLSTVSPNNWEADAKAFAALMRHVREVDKTHRVILVQVENEVGLLRDSRDRSPEANAAFAGSVPRELMEHLQKNKDGLLPEFREVWEAAGFKTSGTWEEVFGKGPKAEEIFMAWNYSRYIDRVAEAGKREYAIPMFVNAWIVQPQDKVPGDYPTGGPQAHMHDVWRAGAPHLDMFCPDIYLPNFGEMAARYTRSGNTLFVPESASGARGAANVFVAVGQYRAVGYSAMGIDSVEEMQGFGPGGPPPGSGQQPVPNIGELPLSVAYATLGQLAPLILEHQTRGTLAAVTLDKDNSETKIRLGDFTLNISLPRGPRDSGTVPDVTGYGIFIATGPDEYYMAGNNLQVVFSPQEPETGFASLAEQEAGRFVNGKWVVTRRLAGDDSTLRDDYQNLVKLHQSGVGVRLMSGEKAIQRVKAYRYE